MDAVWVGRNWSATRPWRSSQPTVLSRASGVCTVLGVWSFEFVVRRVTPLRLRGGADGIVLLPLWQRGAVGLPRLVFGSHVVHSDGEFPGLAGGNSLA